MSSYLDYSHKTSTSGFVSRTDLKTAVRYLRDAAEYYSKTATSVRHEDRARLMRKLANKISNKLNSTEHEKE